MGFFWNTGVRPTDLVDVNSGLLECTPSGSVDWARALRLAQQTADDGVKQALVAAGPASIDAVMRRMPLLKSLLDQHGIQLEVKAAVELTLGSDLFERVVRTSTVVGGLHRRYVMLRVPPQTRLPIAPVVESLSRMNLKTILIAPERCEWLRGRSDQWERFAAAGGMVQLSAASLWDQSDLACRKFCRGLIRQGRCHFVASESGRHHDQPISLRQAYRVITAWSGEAMAKTLCHENAGRLFDDQPIDAGGRFAPRRGLLRVMSSHVSF